MCPIYNMDTYIINENTILIVYEDITVYKIVSISCGRTQMCGSINTEYGELHSDEQYFDIVFSNVFQKKIALDTLDKLAKNYPFAKSVFDFCIEKIKNGEQGYFDFENIFISIN